MPAFHIDTRSKYTILFSHGNAEDLGMIIQYFTEAASILQVNFFAYEYPGYGPTAGLPSEPAVNAAAEAALKYLRDTVGVRWECLILYGRSLGSGPSCHLASKTAVRGLILQAPVLSMYRVVGDFRFTLPGDMFSNLDKIGQIECPTYVIHGTRDEIVPVAHGMELSKLSADPYRPYWVEGGHHNDLEVVARLLFFQRLREFITYLDMNPCRIQLIEQAARSEI